MKNSQINSKRTRRNIALISLVFAAIAYAALVSGAFAQASASSHLIYVADSQNDAAFSQVLAIDADTGKVQRTFRVGNQPDIVLSADGAKLFIASGTPEEGSVLQIFNTATGALLATVPNPDMIQFTSPIYNSQMLLSPSGRYIYMVKEYQVYEQYVAVFDINRQQFLPSQAILSGCTGPAAILPLPEELTLDVKCSNSAFVREITLNDHTADSNEAMVRVQGFDTSVHKFWNVAFALPDARHVGLIAADGTRFMVDRASGRSQLVQGTTDPAEIHTWQRGVLSRDGQTAFVAWGPAGTAWNRPFNKILELDSRTMAQTGEIQSSTPFFSFALSRDGKLLYTANPAAGTVSVLDVASGRQLRQFVAGQTPFIIVPTP